MGQNYDDFRSSQMWSYVQIPNDYYRTRTKIPDELKEKLRAHMKQLYEEGTPLSWIALLYGYDKSHVSRIIRGLPNN